MPLILARPLLHTLQDLSLIGCSVLCCAAVAGFFMLNTLRRILGALIPSFKGGEGGLLGGAGGILGLLELFNLGDIAQRFLGGAFKDDDRRR